MARTTTNSNASNNKKTCIKCQKSKPKNKYYMSTSPNYVDNLYPVCKDCLTKDVDFNDMEQVHNLLLELNKPFIFTLWEKSLEEAEKTGRHVFGGYLKNVNLNFKTYTWKDSEFYCDKNEIIEKDNIEITNKSNDLELDNRNRVDVLRMLGYDPFEGENPNDKRHLYNKLVDLLDESTLEDGLKLQSVIEIVKGFNQVDKINLAITSITNDITNLSKNTGGIKSLITSKKDILASIMKLAEENGISVKHNNQKSKGAGTLTGIIKQLQEKGFEEAEVNLFDIETAQGIRQVADLSNKSIISQLQFDENDYTNMILEQRELIQDLDAKVVKLDEENRLLKKEMLKYKNS